MSVMEVAIMATRSTAMAKVFRVDLETILMMTAEVTVEVTVEATVEVMETFKVINSTIAAQFSA
jgi:hypothetical protein